MDSSQVASKRSHFITAVSVLVGLVLFWSLFLKPADVPLVTKAVAHISGDSSVIGSITFTQSSKSGPVTIKGEIKGLDPLAKRGFHIHQFGDLTTCLTTGSHYNPLAATHGAPSSSSSTRHVGDLGNIDSDKYGVAVFEITDKEVSLNGGFSIIGRAVVVHAGTDDLGKGNNEESLKTGNAGGRAACGVVGIAQ